MTRVAVQPEMLRWARERAGLGMDDLLTRFPKLSEWEQGERQPTLKQLQTYARATLTPVGFLFLSEPPAESVPIPDFRTMNGQGVGRPSPNLLDTIYICQQRQDWYRDYARTHGQPVLDFIGSLSTENPVEMAARSIRERLRFSIEAHRACSTWEAALREFISLADSAGVMVMCSGVVGNNNHRGLDPEEFRGFALSDSLAPVVFINGADTKAAQMFTLAHELAHLWLGQTGLSDADAQDGQGAEVERWCNAVAAELLVPMDAFRSELQQSEALEIALRRLARTFKVSTLVVLRRLFDAQRLAPDEFRTAYRNELNRLRALSRSSGGGNFYLSQAARVSKRFARALVESTLEGQTLYRDAMRMVGVAKVGTFHELGRTLGMPL